MKFITATAIVIFVALNFCGVDRIIAEYNTEKYLKDEISSTDVLSLFDGNGIVTLESGIKIAESKKPLKASALDMISSKIGSKLLSENTDTVIWKELYFDETDGKVHFTDRNKMFSFDGNCALKVSNNHIETVKKALENCHETEYEHSVFIYVSNRSDFSIKSIGLTLTNEENKKTETSVVEDTDGLQLESEIDVNFKNITDEGVAYSVNVSLTDFDGQTYAGKVTGKSFTDGETIVLVSTDNQLFAAYDGSMVRLEKIS